MSGVVSPLEGCLRQLHLPAFREHCHAQAAVAEKNGASFTRYLHELCELELVDRRQRRIQRRLKQSKLPRTKTLDSFDRSRLPTPVDRQMAGLLEGDFLDRQENVLWFGNPGSGKTHLMCALGHELIQQDRSVLFTSCALLVQRLLRSKAELTLEKELKRLDRFEALLIDDLGYVQQNREEMEALFTLLSHRYESRSVLLTSNLVFSQWEAIFKDLLTTAAAIDRLVHHSVILELNVASYRMETAKNLRQTKARKGRQNGR
jgi:DNA replication protein DnaC